MTRKHIGLDIQHNGILVAIANKKRRVAKIETFTIPLAGRVLTHGVVSNEPLLQSAFKTLVNKLGADALYHILLDRDQTLIKSISLPEGVKLNDYQVLIENLLPKLFSLPSNEVAYDYRINKTTLTIAISQKKIITSWQQFFENQKLKLTTIATKAAFCSSSSAHDCLVKQLLTEHKYTFNLLPWRRRLMAFHFRVNLSVFPFYLLVVVVLLYWLWQNNHNKQFAISAKLQQLICVEQQKKNNLQELTVLQEQLSLMESNEKDSQKFLRHNARVLAVFQMIGSIIPHNIFLNAISYQEAQLTLFGQSWNYLLLRKMIEKLKTIPFIAHCQLKRLRVDNNLLVFELDIQLGEKQ